VQRTNQLNFSGNRYSQEELEKILADPEEDTFILEVQDRFGNYGLVGFAIVKKDREKPCLTDLALSCRVQAKKIEHAFLLYLMRKYKAQGSSHLDVLYHKTDRNTPAGSVFDDLSFSLLDRQHNLLHLTHALDKEILPLHLVRIDTL
jgi:FkbH-like protein